jgi:hypothetical protein
MDERDRRLIALKDSVKSFFEVTGVGSSGWEAGFQAVRRHDEMAETFVTEMRRLLMFIEEEFEIAGRPSAGSVPLRPMAPGPRPGALGAPPRNLTPAPPRPAAPMIRPAPPAPSQPAAAPAAAPARPAPAAPRAPLSVPGTGTSPGDRPKHPRAADVPEDPTERVSVPSFTPPRRRK